MSAFIQPTPSQAIRAFLSVFGDTRAALERLPVFLDGMSHNPTWTAEDVEELRGQLEERLHAA